MNQRDYPSTFEFCRPRHLLLWLDSYIMRLSQYEKKKKADGQAHLVVG